MLKNISLYKSWVTNRNAKTLHEMYFNSSSCIQKHINLFWVVSILCFNFFVRFRYQAELASSKWGCIYTLQSQASHNSADVKKIILSIERLQLVVKIIWNFAIASPETASSNKHPRYLTLEYCPTFISHYFMLSFSIFSYNFSDFKI